MARVKWWAAVLVVLLAGLAGACERQDTAPAGRDEAVRRRPLRR